MEKKKLTVFIGRFSPFHNGHGDVLRRALNSSENVLVLVGSAEGSRNIKNPFTLEERTKLITDFAKNCRADAKLFVSGIRDFPYNNQRWIESVQREVRALTDKLGHYGPVYLTGADRDSTTWYLNAFGSFFEKDFVTHVYTDTSLSATQVRESLFDYLTIPTGMLPGVTVRFLLDFMKTKEFLELVKEYAFVKKYKKSWETAPHPPTFVTTDACVIQSGHVLVVVRDNYPGKGLWALPGGFLEQHETLVDGCVRELLEETRIGLSKAQLYGSIKAKEVFDAPDRSTRGRTLTTCFLFKLDDTKPLPSVKAQAGEVKKVMWLPILEALSNPQMWYEDHLPITETMLARASTTA